MLESQTLT